MTDISSQQPVPTVDEGARGTAILAYILYLIGWPTCHLSTIVALILAYIKRGETRGTIWDSHFGNLVHVFWIGVVFWVLFICAGLVWLAGSWHAVIVDDFPAPIFALPLLGLVFIAYVVWYLYRVVRGLLRALENRAYA
jgi:uncharacterized membrane protein